MKETVNVTERGTGRETESGRERGSVNGTARETVRENGNETVKGIETGRETETESVTERRAGLLEMLSTPPSGDQVCSRWCFSFLFRGSILAAQIWFEEGVTEPMNLFVPLRYRAQLGKQ